MTNCNTLIKDADNDGFKGQTHPTRWRGKVSLKIEKVSRVNLTQDTGNLWFNNPGVLRNGHVATSPL
jgi:hypothetical protein